MSLPILTYIQMSCSGLYSDVNVANYVTAAEGRTNATWYGDNYNEAVALRACHNWTLDNTRPCGEPGAIASKSEGGQSLSFSNPSGGSPSDLDQTVFGARLKSLRRASGPTAGVITGTPQPVIPPNMKNWGNY